MCKYIGCDNMNWFMPNVKVIKNYSHLDADNLPASVNDIIHRDDELNTLRCHFASVFTGEAPTPIFLYGIPGTGKTALVRVVTNTLETTATSEGLDVFCPYVNCRVAKSKYGVYKELVELYEQKTGEITHNNSNSAVQQQKNFIEIVNKYDGISIIILDEIDKGDVQDILYLLTRIKASKQSTKRIGIICISNDEKCIDDYEPGTKSSISQTIIKLDQYNANELTDILADRAEKALYPTAYDLPLIQLCAALIAKRDGDARKAIMLLHCAAMEAQKIEISVITPEIVEECEKKARHVVKSKELSKLSTQFKLVLAAAMYATITTPTKGVTTENTYIIYSEMCAKINAVAYARKTFMDILKDLELESKVDIIKTSYGRGKGVRNVITTTLNPKETLQELLKDMLLAELWEYINPFEKYA